MWLSLAILAGSVVLAFVFGVMVGITHENSVEVDHMLHEDKPDK